VSRFFTKVLLAAVAATANAAEQPDWALALPGWKYEFPRDNFTHPDFKTEWWYFTGNLRAEDEREYGFQLTFFRQGVRRGKGATTRFAVDDIKLAHFAVTDIDGKQFRYAQRVSRGSFGEAGFSDGDRIAWIEDWSLRATGPGQFRLEAEDEVFALALDLSAFKAPVFHGEDGVSQKAEGKGRGSHYYSYTRLAAEGTLKVSGRVIPVTGWSWFDQEWATNQLTEDQTGWDWFSVQFDDNTELMLFQIRLKDGGRDPFSHGTWIGEDGQATTIKDADFELVPGRLWRSKATGGEYPMEWTIRIQKLGLELTVRSVLDDQELALQPIAYWEGSVQAEGKRNGEPLRGRGYLEMTGYAGGLVGLQAPDTR
jgi:predicted secreted hydrolase